MKHLYKSTKVIYNAHLMQYEVYYKNFLFWNFDSCYKFDENKTSYPTHYLTKEKAEELAINRAESMLKTVEVWKKSKFLVD